MKIKKDMLIRVVSGNDKGKEGKVLFVLPKKSKVVVEGINITKRTIRPTQENPSGGFVEREAPIHVSNLMVVHNNQTVRVGWKILKDGSKVRIAKKINEELKI